MYLKFTHGNGKYIYIRTSLVYIHMIFGSCYSKSHMIIKTILLV